MDIRELMAIAEAVVDDAERMFCAGLGSGPALHKPRGDFATEVDLGIESHLRDTLTTLTGIPVMGEETGGATSGTRWVIDPIDGTANYAAGNPMCAILVSLLVEETPVLGITSMPLLGRRLTAMEGSPLLVNGKPTPPLKDRPSHVAHVGFSSVSSPEDTLYPKMVRHGLLSELADSYLRPRITGSIGVDLAFAAEGIFDGVVSFSPHVWDNAAGVMLVTAAGGKVTDAEGNPWTPGSRGVIAGTDKAHAVIMGTIDRIRSEQETM